jgi:hypothetical protein
MFKKGWMHRKKCDVERQGPVSDIVDADAAINSPQLTTLKFQTSVVFIHRVHCREERGETKLCFWLHNLITSCHAIDGILFTVYG